VPEGHTIHRHAATHRRLLAGHPLTVSSPQGRFGDGAAVLDGRRLERVEAWGKHEWLWFEGDAVLHVHLGLFGRWRKHPAGPPPEPRGQVRVRLHGPLGTTDLSGPTACELGDPTDRDAVVARLGPDPLRPDADPERFFDTLARSRRAVGLLLMDQSVIAGIGNVYRAEALFVNGIWPLRTGRELGDDERRALWDTVVRQLRAGVRSGRIVTVDRSEQPSAAGRGARGKATYVYKREHCWRCGTPVARWDLAGRWCYACPSCQPS
jgi:formamidopyrimidine-DNA glycosylase